MITPRKKLQFRITPRTITKKKRGTFTLLWISSFLLSVALILLVFQLVTFAHRQRKLPEGLVIAGVPVGGLDQQTSIERLLTVYYSPVEVHYGDAIMYLDPAAVNFQPEIDGMLSEIDLAQTRQGFWKDFWDYLWDRSPEPIRKDIPLEAAFSESSLHKYLEDIAARYDRSPTPAIPIVGTIQIRPGSEGISLDIGRSIPLIKQALHSPSNRAVTLPLLRTQPTNVSLLNLETFLKQTITVSKFDGLTAFYFLNLQTGDEIHFAFQNGADIPVKPDIAFSAASIIKIPILVSIFRRIDEQPNPEILNLIKEMIEKSGNAPADWVMDRVIEKNIAPTLISADMSALGLENTFLAGQFYAGAPLLVLYQTPANQRTDVNTDPDLYNQTTASDMGMLLEDLYQCGHFGGGALLAVFQGEITRTECQTMIDYLTGNHIAALIEAGVPDGTRIAHKHGWVSLSGIMNTLGDASIISTPGGDYVLVIFLYQPTQLVWEPASRLVADLSRLIYTYFNPSHE